MMNEEGYNPLWEVPLWDAHMWGQFAIMVLLLFFLAWGLINGLLAKRPKGHYLAKRARARRKAARA